jgi:WD40 repeat protein/uncharacterized caspase-like protein
MESRHLRQGKKIWNLILKFGNNNEQYIMKNTHNPIPITAIFLFLLLFMMQEHIATAQTSGLNTIVQQGHKTSIHSLAFAPDGEKFVSHSYTDNSLMIWSKQGLLIKSVPLNYEMKLEFTHDSKFLIGKNNIYDLNGNKILALSPGSNNGVNCSKMSPDGKIIALGLDNTNIPNKRKIRIIDRQGNIIRLINGTNHTPFCIAFSPDGKLLVVGAGSINPQGYIVGQEEPLDPACEVVIMDIEGNILKVLPVANDVKSVAFSADGQRVIAATDRGKVLNWKVDGTLISESNVSGVSEVKYNPDNKYFLAIGYGALTLFDPNGVVVRNFSETTNGNSIPAKGTLCNFSPDGKYILTCNGGDIFIWNVNGTLVYKIPSFDAGQIWSPLKMTTQGDRFYSGKELWSMEGKRISLPMVGYGYVFSDDMKYAASVDRAGSIVLAVDGSRSFEMPGVKVAEFTHDGIIGRPESWRNVNTARFDFNGKFVDSVKANNPEVYSTDRKYYFVSNYNRLDLFEASKKKIQTFYNPDSSSVGMYSRQPYVLNGGFFSPDSKMFARNIKRGIALHELPSGRQIAELSTVTTLSNGSEINDGSFGNGMALDQKNKKLFFSKDSKRVYILGYFGLYAYDLKGNKVLDGPDISDIQGQFPEMVVSNDESYLISYSGDMHLQRISIKTGEILSTSRVLENTVSQMTFTPNGKHLLTKDGNGTVRLWNPETLQEVVTFYGLGESDYAIVTPDGYYTASKNAGRYMHFSKEMKTFTFDNFDLIYNRPDIIVKRLGYGSDEMVEGLKNAYLKRLRKMGFTEEQMSLDVHLPEIQILTKEIPPLTETKFLTTQIKVSDSKYLLDRINVYVNEVPLFGSKGLSLKELKTSTLTRDIKVELVNGRNLIQYAVMNDKGAESIKETVEINYTGPIVKPVLYALTIGVSDYTDNVFDLKYAAKDATDLSTLLATNKTNFAEVKVLKIVDAAATKENIKKAKEFLAASRVDDQVILFVAGHGLLDDDMNFYFATSNVDFNNPGALGLPYEDLEGLLDEIPARKKLMLIDACHSGEVDKDETVFTNATAKSDGGTVASRGFKNVTKKEGVGLKSSFELMQELFTDLRRGSGAIVISSASGVEFAFESDAWKNGVFTYSVLEGLKTGTADRNKDGAVGVAELRDYVIKKVGELTNGKQHPTSRKESLEFDFKVW